MEDCPDYRPFAGPEWEGSGLTASQLSTLELRGSAERMIRRAMTGTGATSEEIEEFVSANLPPIGDFVREVFSRRVPGTFSRPTR